MPKNTTVEERALRLSRAGWDRRLRSRIRLRRWPHDWPRLPLPRDLHLQSRAFGQSQLHPLALLCLRRLLRLDSQIEARNFPHALAVQQRQQRTQETHCAAQLAGALDQQITSHSCSCSHKLLYLHCLLALRRLTVTLPLIVVLRVEHPWPLLLLFSAASWVVF